MTILTYKVVGKLYQMETGPEVQVGDQVKIFLDTVANPGWPAFVFGTIQPGIESTGCCDEYTTYLIEYDEGDLGSGLITPTDVLSVATTSAADVVAADLLDERNRAIAAEEVLQDNIDAEELARIGAVSAEETTRSNADTALSNRISPLESDAVRFTPQTNSAARQENARANLGITNRVLTDASSNASVNWQNRTLHGVSNLVLTWSNSGVAIADGRNISLGTTTGTMFGESETQKIGFHGVTPTVRRAAASQGALATTGATTGAYGYTQAQANAIISLVNEIRAVLVEKGLMKGSA